MNVIPDDLASAARAARERLTADARAAAASGAGAGARPGAPGAMTSAAREAIFADALISAMHARFEELRTVAK